MYKIREIICYRRYKHCLRVYILFFSPIMCCKKFYIGIHRTITKLVSDEFLLLKQKLASVLFLFLHFSLKYHQINNCNFILFERSCSQDVEGWPYQSPDFNPIKHLWNKLGQRLKKSSQTFMKFRKTRKFFKTRVSANSSWKI